MHKNTVEKQVGAEETKRDEQAVLPSPAEEETAPATAAEAFGMPGDNSV